VPRRKELKGNNEYFKNNPAHITGACLAAATRWLRECADISDDEDDKYDLA